jgi:glutathione S-transferase
MLRIYGRANSINVRKVLWLLDEIGVASTREDYGRGFKPTTAPDFRRVSEFGVVPVMDDDGFILRESNTMLRYLATKHGRADLYPSEIKARALIDQWMDWASTDLYWGGARTVFLARVVKMPAFQEPSLLAAGEAEWNRQMTLLDRHLAASGPYVTAGGFTIADIPAGLVVNRWFSIDFNRPALPAVAAYYERLSARPAYRAHGRNGTP